MAGVLAVLAAVLAVLAAVLAVLVGYRCLGRHVLAVLAGHAIGWLLNHAVVCCIGVFFLCAALWCDNWAQKQEI